MNPKAQEMTYSNLKIQRPGDVLTYKGKYAYYYITSYILQHPITITNNIEAAIEAASYRGFRSFCGHLAEASQQIQCKSSDTWTMTARAS